jgi:hypothetical protein
MTKEIPQTAALRPDVNLRATFCCLEAATRSLQHELLTDDGAIDTVKAPDIRGAALTAANAAMHIFTTVGMRCSEQ